METAKYKESDLFEPIREFFRKDGFTGDGEVGTIDLYLEKDGLSVAVELKKTLDLKAIEQAALDQKNCDLVFIGIFKPKDLYSKANKNKIYLLKRLGIGLILVSERTLDVELYAEPVVSELSNFQKRNKKQTEKLKKEFRERKLKGNIGGVSKTKRMTAYREDSLVVLYHLNRLGGQASPGELRNQSGVAKTTGILYDNYNGWFEHVDKGQYRISPKGNDALNEYRAEIEKIKNTASQASACKAVTGITPGS